MSLLIWLPLHGNLNNYGLSPAKFSMVNTSSGLSVATTGKTSNSCYQRTKTNTVDHITSDINFTLDGDVTMACWCKVTAHGNSSSANGIITQHGHQTGGLGITMKYVAAGDYRMSVNTGLRGDSFSSERDRTYHTYYGNTNIYNDWHHLCVTYNNTTKKIHLYVDGKMETIQNYGESVTLNGNNTTARPFRLFDWSTDHSHNADYRPACQLNDVRVYDECLSPKEVKMLSQGLIAHYKLSAGNGSNLLVNTTHPKNTNSLASFPTSNTIEYDNTLKQNVFTCKINTSSSPAETYIYSSRTPQISPSTKYTFSCDIWVNDYFKSTEFFWLSDTEDNKKTGSSYVNVTQCSARTFTPNQWHHATWTFTTKSNDYTGYIRVDNNGTKTNGSYAIMKITNLKLEKGEVATPHSLSVSETGIHVGRDCSGYKNHGTPTGNIQITSNSGGRYIASAEFNGASYINCGRGPMVKDAITVNWWGYMDDWSLYGSTPMRAISCTEGGGWNFEPQSSKMSFACGTGTSSNAYKSATSTTAFSSYTPGWHMFTGTYDGLNTKIYIDGKLEKTTAAYTTKTPIYYASNSIFIGAEAAASQTTPTSPYYTGKLSDVRIYARALTDSEIEELFNMSASVANNGVLLSYDLIEDNTSNIKIKQDGTVICNKIDESGTNFKMIENKLIKSTGFYEV